MTTKFITHKTIKCRQCSQSTGFIWHPYGDKPEGFKEQCPECGSDNIHISLVERTLDAPMRQSVIDKSWGDLVHEEAVRMTRPEKYQKYD